MLWLRSAVFALLSSARSSCSFLVDTAASGHPAALAGSLIAGSRDRRRLRAGVVVLGLFDDRSRTPPFVTPKPAVRVLTDSNPMYRRSDDDSRPRTGIRINSAQCRPLLVHRPPVRGDLRTDTETNFGASYSDYRLKVRRWLPAAFSLRRYVKYT